MKKLFEFIKSNSLITSIIIVIIFGLSIFLLTKNHGPTNDKVQSGDYFEIPSITANEDYGKDFKTYNTDLGFSFKYPAYLKVMVDKEGTVGRYFLTPIKEQLNDDYSAIIISVAENNEKFTAEEWLLGPKSGFNKADGYYKTKIDGQDVVYTDGGMWTVVNTKDNKYRLSIADLQKVNGDILFTEMGIVIESLTFR